MMNKKCFSLQALGRCLPGVLLAVALLPASSVLSQDVHEGRTVIEAFLSPAAPARPMARMWFPDASAGEDDNDFIGKQVTELAAKGFGGVEVAMIMTNVELNFSCPQMRVSGMGSDVGQNPELVAIYTTVVKRAVKIPVIPKMTPNITHISHPALAAYFGGADAISAINTIKSVTMADDAQVSGQRTVSGYSGRAVKPIALRFIDPAKVARVSLWRTPPASLVCS